MEKVKMKTPISYYGGKQSMLKHILPLIPAHTQYVEPFAGGAAVFWAKEPVRSEILNDKNGMVINFYEQLKTNYNKLKQLIDATPYSREAYKRAMVVYDCPYLFDPVIRAWALWVGTSQGFNHQIASWRSVSQSGGKESRLNYNMRLNFSIELADRLKEVQLESKDAVALIKATDGSDTFFYVDPPYVEADQGHYGGYLQCHFDALLDALAGIRGKFLLSSYPNAKLSEMVKECGWQQRGVDMVLSASNSKKRKVEMLTWNYD